jgi:secreted PhoX family phosphatase
MALKFAGINTARPAFLWKSAALTGLTVATPLQALAARAQEGAALPRRRRRPDYGPLYPVADETTGLPLLHLPQGFRYVSFGWTGDPLADGTPTPALHDGMAAFSFRGGRLRLVRNHEIGPGTPFETELAYDPGAGGGTTTLEFNAFSGKVTKAWASISGTVRNCAGGPTPWGSWISGEETTEGPTATNGLTKPHGYAFEVPVVGTAAPEPIRDMGRFSHEAMAVDPATGDVYETEDAGNNSGFYKFVPRHPGHLHFGGTLSMLALRDHWQADMRTNQPSEPRAVTWVPIGVPDPADPAAQSVFSQGFAGGGARFARLEGCWYGNQRIYFVSTSGGNSGQGQVWEYDPAAETLRLLFESPGTEVLNAPDNLCVSPRGGLVLCEDGGGIEFVHGLTVDGTIFRFARNNVVLGGERNGIAGDFRGSEFAGACYSPDGRWLFFNVQSPGITFAVTGPWGSGAL